MLSYLLLFYPQNIPGSQFWLTLVVQRLLMASVIFVSIYTTSSLEREGAFSVWDLSEWILPLGGGGDVSGGFSQDLCTSVCVTHSDKAAILGDTRES